MDNTASLWKWVNGVLLPSFFNVTWYNGQPFEQKEGFISNKKNFLMGMPRLRQLRLKKGKNSQALLNCNKSAAYLE